MKYLNNQKGFGAFEGVIIVVALVAIGAAGYFAYQARQDKTDYSVNVPRSAKQEKKASSSSTPQDLTAGWKSYSGQGVSFKYPAEYYVNTENQGVIEVTSYKIVNGEGQVRCSQSGQSIPACEVKVSIPLDGSAAGYAPDNSDLKVTAQQIIATIKKQ